MKWMRIRAGEYECEFECQCRGWIDRRRANEWVWRLRYGTGFTDGASGTCWTLGDAQYIFSLDHAKYCRSAKL